MNAIDYARAKQQVSLDQVLRLIGWRATEQRGAQQRGPCPLHQRGEVRGRAFAVRGDGWYCHKCKDGGDQLHLYALVKGLPLYEATRELCRTLGVVLTRKQVRYPLFDDPRNREEER